MDTKEIRWAPDPIQMSWPFSGWRHDWVPNDMTPDRYTVMELHRWLMDEAAKERLYEGGD